MTRAGTTAGLLIIVATTVSGCALIDGLSGTAGDSPDNSSPDAGPGNEFPAQCKSVVPNVLQHPDFSLACKPQSVTGWAVTFGPGWLQYAGRPLESDNTACMVGADYGCNGQFGLGPLADADGCLAVWGALQTPIGTWTEVRQKVTAPAAIRGLNFSYLRRGRQLLDWKFGVHYEVAGVTHPLEEFDDDVLAGRFQSPGIVQVEGAPTDLTIVIRLERTGATMLHVWVTLDDLKLDLCMD